MSARGLTLLEILVALALTGLMMTAIAPLIFQIMKGTARDSGEAVALADIDLAAHWISRDIIQGSTTDLIDAQSPETHMRLDWTDLTGWGESEGPIAHTITYTYDAPTGELERDFDGQVSIVGHHLTDVGFSISGRTVTVTLTSSPDSFNPRPVERRTYSFYLRASTAL